MLAENRSCLQNIDELYSYQPLRLHSSIRLLILKPGEGEQDVHCDLIEIDLNDKPEYFALSYCWGEPKFDVPIYCSGKRLSITANLSQALCRFRNISLPITLWVDAICINQDDDEERSQQVEKMKDVYSHAREVYIWLGPEDDRSPMVMAVLEAHQKKAKTPGFHVRDHFDGNAPEWQAVKDWLLRPWFWRVWTIQEARLAKSATAFFGPYHVDLATIDLVMTMSEIEDNQGMAKHLDEAFTKPGLSVRLSAHRPWKLQSSLLNLLLSSRRHHASDPRDKVYGLLGLVSAYNLNLEDITLLKPDYRKPIGNVYRDTARFLINKYKSIDVLNSVYTDETSVDRGYIPS